MGARAPGLGAAPSRRTAVFSPAHAHWIEGPPLPVARFDAVAVASATRIHLLGGEGEAGRRPPAEALDPIAMAWLEHPQPTTTGRVAATVADGVIHLFSTSGTSEPPEPETCVVDDVFYVQGVVGA